MLDAKFNVWWYYWYCIEYESIIHSFILPQSWHSCQRLFKTKNRALKFKAKNPSFVLRSEKTMKQCNFAALEKAGPETEFFLIANGVDIKTFKMILLYFSHIFLINSILQDILIHKFYKSSSMQRFTFIWNTNTFVGKYKDCLDRIIGWQYNFLFSANFIVHLNYILNNFHLSSFSFFKCLTSQNIK